MMVWIFAMGVGIALVPSTQDGRTVPQGAQRVWEAYLEAHAANGDFSGVVRVSRHNRVVYQKVAGKASQRFGIPNRPETRFLVASVTKTFTAAAIALLQDEGKLQITDGLDRFLPDFPPASRIKLGHLLAHQSGLDNPDYQAIAARAVSPEELLVMIAARPLLFEPGTGNRYSNAGYVTLGRVIEKVSGESYEGLLHRRIFAPLGMQHSGTLRSGAIIPDLAEGYIPSVGTELRHPQPRDPSSLFGSGNVYSTAEDLDRWLAAIDRHQLFDISKQPYPFGWGKRIWFEKAVLVQSGITDGYSSVILTVPAEELHIVVLMNTQSGFTGDEGKTLLGIALGHAPEIPARRVSPASVSLETLGSYVGVYAWGEAKVPMHIEREENGLTLRWGESASVVPLTPLNSTEFLDRSSFGRIRFEAGGLVWTQNGVETVAPRAPQRGRDNFR